MKLPRAQVGAESARNVRVRHISSRNLTIIIGNYLETTISARGDAAFCEIVRKSANPEFVAVESVQTLQISKMQNDHSELFTCKIRLRYNREVAPASLLYH